MNTIFKPNEPGTFNGLPMETYRETQGLAESDLQTILANPSAYIRGERKEQPVSVAFEGDDRRPYKPSKSMRRVLVSMWGMNAAVFIGRRLTLYRDPTVKFAGEAVGGIKISHASDITEPMEIALTVTRGSRKPHRVLPLLAEPEFDATGFPAAWTDWSSEERGDFMATQGSDKLKAWWGTLSKQDRKTLEPRLRSDWQPAAAHRQESGGASA